MLHAVAPTFDASSYDASETQGKIVIRLTAPILTWSTASGFNGSIEVDVIAMDLPSDDHRQRAEFGEHCIPLTYAHSVQLFFEATMSMCPLTCRVRLCR